LHGALERGRSRLSSREGQLRVNDVGLPGVARGYSGGFDFDASSSTPWFMLTTERK
jgi:hypothetical protein